MSRKPATPCSEEQLAALALSLGAREVRGWSPIERKIVQNLAVPLSEVADSARKQILSGEDPLGDIFCKIRSTARRREDGATYTPRRIVEGMFGWATQQEEPARVVDPGVGSARFLIKAAHHFKSADLVGIEIDPLAALVARANIAVSGLQERATVLLEDYRTASFPKIDKKTLFIGNPPYVRHHQITPVWKQWLTETASRLGFKASQLSGLHTHFFLATIIHGQPGDFGTFITSAEWLDVNYGRLVREMFLGRLGGTGITVVEPTMRPFPDAATTAVITTFEIASQARSFYVKRVKNMKQLESKSRGQRIRRERFENECRWTHFTRPRRNIPSGFVELGEICRVHRGAVTGANRVWIAGPHSNGLPENVLFPSITKARELFEAGQSLDDLRSLRRVIDLPVDLDVLSAKDRKAVDQFLQHTKARGIHRGYIASNRKAWWSVGLRRPAPILATYMARRPPAFVRNLVDARHINIAHGLYPREELKEKVLVSLVDYLSTATDKSAGRTYAGGLVKFEPREMERIPIPPLAVLEQVTA